MDCWRLAIVEYSDIWYERLMAMMWLCRFLYIYIPLYLLIPYVFVPIHLSRGSATNVIISLCAGQPPRIPTAILGDGVGKTTLVVLLVVSEYACGYASDQL